MPGPLLVGIDASRAVSARPTGTETYSRELIAALLALDSLYRFRLYFRAPPPPGTFGGAELCVIPFPRMWTHLRLSLEMARRPPDLLFVPAHVLPLARPAQTLVTVHDLGYLHFPRAHPLLQRIYLDLSTRWNVRVATRVIVDSQATRADLLARYRTAPDKVVVAYPGYDERLAPVRDPQIIAAVQARYGIDRPYLLYLGTLQPRKNLLRLIDGFAALRWNGLLVLAGRRGWLCDEIVERARRLDVAERVLLPGYVPQADKAPLLSGALAFVFPSLYEGFGLPILEAQACGCPVICSDTSSLPEVAGDGALLVPPESTAAWSEALGRIVAEAGLRRDLVERGDANLGRFSWKRCARTVLQTIESLVGSGR